MDGGVISPCSCDRSTASIQGSTQISPDMTRIEMTDPLHAGSDRSVPYRFRLKRERTSDQ